jgi:hypothetical protein
LFQTKRMWSLALARSKAISTNLAIRRAQRWLTHDLETMKKRLKALKAKSTQEGLVLMGLKWQSTTYRFLRIVTRSRARASSRTPAAILSSLVAA